MLKVKKIKKQMTYSDAAEMIRDDMRLHQDFLSGEYRKALNMAITALKAQEWIPCSERMPEHSYTKRFWLTVKLDDGTITTLIGTWGAWGGNNGSKSYDAFDCWKDTMINGGIYRLSQPVPKEQVLAWMPLPEPYKSESVDKE